jgi:predicted acyl esterase
VAADAVDPHVPARDGVGLHARLWRPVSDERLPVVVNLDP